MSSTSTSQNKGAVGDPFLFLKSDHREVKELFKKIDGTTKRAVVGRTKIFEKLDAALSLHAELEERFLYPALEEKEETRPIALEGVEEHKVVKNLLSLLSSLSPSEETWTAKFAVLKENVTHHVKEEETEMFPKAKKALTVEEQNMIATKMSEYLRAHNKQVLA